MPKENLVHQPVVWIGFNNFRKGAKVKYRNQDKIIDLAYYKDEFICDSCMYPTSYIYFSEINNGKIIGEYKFIASGSTRDLKYTRFSDNKSFYYYHDQRRKQFTLTPCF